MTPYSCLPLGQFEAFEQLCQNAKSQGIAGIPQSTILLGPNGIGKRQTLRAFFQHLKCLQRTDLKPCGVCSECKKIFNCYHIDWMNIGSEGQHILVDDLRDLKARLAFAPIDGSENNLVRFVVFDNAERLTPQAANALLKMLEEPAPHTKFFLITHDRSLLLPTLLSRSQTLLFKPLSIELQKEILTQKQINFSEWPAMIEMICFDLLASGLERLSELEQSEVIETLGQWNELYHTHKPLSYSDSVKLSETLHAENKRLMLFIDYLQVLTYKNILKTKHKKLFDLHLRLSEIKQRSEQNANKKLLALCAADIFWELKACSA